MPPVRPEPKNGAGRVRAWFAQARDEIGRAAYSLQSSSDWRRNIQLIGRRTFTEMVYFLTCGREQGAMRIRVLDALTPASGRAYGLAMLDGIYIELDDVDGFACLGGGMVERLHLEQARKTLAVVSMCRADAAACPNVVD